MRVLAAFLIGLLFTGAVNAAVITASSERQVCVGSNSNPAFGCPTAYSSFDLSITGLTAPVAGSSGGNFTIRAFGDFNANSETLSVTTELGQTFRFFDNSPTDDDGTQYSSVLSRTIGLGPLTTAAIADGTFTLSFLVSNAVNNLSRNSLSFVEFDLTYDAADIVGVPGPASLGLLGLGLIGLGFAKRKQAA